MHGTVVDVKHCLCSKSLYSLLAPSVFNPTPERLFSLAQRYQQDERTKVCAYLDDREYRGIIVFEIADRVATILHIAVKHEHRGNGIGSRLIHHLFDCFHVRKIIAETDDDAVDFYKKCEFSIADTMMKFDTKKYICICESKTNYLYQTAE